MSTIILATKTISKIDEMIRRDQGASFRQHLGKLIPLAHEAYEGGKDEFRRHLGGSMIGRECARELWYNFHWAKPSEFPPNILRLFNRGHLEEPRLVALLLSINVEVWAQDPDGNQFRIEGSGGHFGSAIDAVIRGCPDMPAIPMLGEFKTHNDKSFKKLEKDGVRNAKFEHFVQMQIYMGFYKLTHGLYLAVNKNDDMLYGEIIEFDQAICDMYFQRADRIIFAETIPPRINDNIAFFKCRYCNYKDICHQEVKPVMNCRTCAGAVPTSDGQWQCVKFNKPINKKEQMAGCAEHDLKIDFVG